MTEDSEHPDSLTPPVLEKVASLRGGTLYLVATPIGNLEDLTFRAFRLLRDADVLLCEDTRHTGQLLKAFGIRRGMLSLHKFNEKSREARVLADLGDGKVVAMVSDAGTPGISDPGARMVASAWDAGYRVESIPGACAVVVALTVSGLPADNFTFVGFLPIKSGRRTRELERLAEMTSAIVIYESPHRIAKLLDELERWLPGRELAVCRELTKRFEEVVRGDVRDVKKQLEGRKARGEYVVVVGQVRETKKRSAEL